MKELFLIALAVCSLSASAQHTKIVDDELIDYKKAINLYNNGSYSLAYPIFKNLQNSLRSTDKKNKQISSMDIEYYAAACGLVQNDTNAVYAAQQFIDAETNTPRTHQLSYLLGNYQFGKQRFVQAIALYEQAAIENLSNVEIAKMKYNLGYSYFTQQEFSKAKPLFNTIRQMPENERYLDANYYYGFIAYYDKQYKPALESFLKVENHPDYKTVVPFYITQIYYLTGQKDKALVYAEEMIKKGDSYYQTEALQLVGHGYFEKKNFAKALPYLDKYIAVTEKVRREDVYELAFCHYQEKNWQKAIDGFKQLSGKEDSLSQNSMYLLADAYLKTSQKSNARNAFQFCAINSSNAAQREVAKYNYAKLSYELGYTDIGMQEMKEFLLEYENSIYVTEGRELVVAMLSKTNNFREAQEQIEQLKNPSASTQKIYPRILYGRATEFINDQDYNTADKLLNKVINDKYNAPVLPLTYFWKGELSFRNSNWDTAISYLNKYVAQPVVNGEVNTVNAKYSLGYAYLRKEDYKQALIYFNDISKNATNSSSLVEQDAYIKAADCFFMQKDLNKSILMYDVAISKKWPSADYALFQKAMATGASNTAGKIALLKQLESNFVSSTLITDTEIELANTYMADTKYSEAIVYLNKILAGSATSGKPSALLNLAVCYAGMNNETEALNYYKRLLKDYPNSEEASDAVGNIENIYVKQGRANEYAEFMRGAGRAISVTREDSLTFNAAENLYDAKDYTNAMANFKNYLVKFPTGQFLLEANSYIAEMYNDQKEYTNALPYFETIAAKGPSLYAERATTVAAKIYFYEIKDYAKSENYFAQLRSLATTDEGKIDALRGLLRSQYLQKKYQAASTNAAELLLIKNNTTDDKVLANLTLAKSAQLDKNYTEAITKYKSVVALNKAGFGAEARYEIANCLFAQNKYAEAEKAANEVINKSGSYEFWLIKSYILIGDIYTIQKDYFNAKATYQSIVENASIDELKLEAQTKLDKVKADEAAASKINN